MPGGFSSVRFVLQSIHMTDHQSTPPSCPNDQPPHLSPQQFRTLGYRMIDTIATYMQSIEAYPVRSPDKPGDIRKCLPPGPPQTGLGMTKDPTSAWDAIFDDITRIILPGLMHWQHPSFFGYFPCNASSPAILGELLSAGLGVQGMLWQTSPACTELETHMLDWCVDLFNLPACFRSDAADPSGRPTGGGVIQSTASEATLCAIVAARFRWKRRTNQRNQAIADAQGDITLAASTTDQPFAIICSEAAHSSVAKASMLAGIIEDADDHDRLWLIPTDATGSMDVRKLKERLELARDTPGSPIPICCVATMGTTGTGAFDPIDDIAQIVLEHDLWLHVDGAWAGSALVCPEHRNIARGIEHAHSLCINPHKWLLTNFDCDLFWTQCRDDLIGAMRIDPDYLHNQASASGRVIDYRDWQVPLGRRFRALKLWFVIRHYGIEGLQAHIRRHIELAQMVERLVKYDDRFELIMPRSLSLVCFAHARGNQATQQLIDTVNRSGKLFLTHATLPDGRLFARFAIGATHTEERHIRAAWKRITQAADAIC